MHPSTSARRLHRRATQVVTQPRPNKAASCRRRDRLIVGMGRRAPIRQSSPGTRCTGMNGWRSRWVVRRRKLRLVMGTSIGSDVHRDFCQVAVLLDLRVEKQIGVAALQRSGRQAGPFGTSAARPPSLSAAVSGPRPRSHDPRACGGRRAHEHGSDPTVGGRGTGAPDGGPGRVARAVRCTCQSCSMMLRPGPPSRMSRPGPPTRMSSPSRPNRVSFPSPRRGGRLLRRRRASAASSWPRPVPRRRRRCRRAR